MDHHDKGRSEMIRDLIYREYIEVGKKEFGYSGILKAKEDITKKSKKDEAEDKMNTIRAMSAMELSRFLHDIGYLPMDITDEGTGIIEAHRIIEKPNGEKAYEQQSIQGEGGPVLYRREVFSTFDEIIRDVKKEKKL